MKKIVFFFILLAPLTVAAASPSIIINELAWMGTTESANDEWLELYNPNDAEIDLTGWRLEALDGSPKIELTGTIAPGAYFLLERTDDDTIAEITADQIYSGALGNNGEWLKLYDNQNNLIDEINAAAGWPAGDNTTKQTLERAADLSWQTSQSSSGTPKTQNSQSSNNSGLIGNDDSQTSTTTPTTNEATSQTPPAGAAVKKGDIIFNEIFPNPSGPDNQNEFIEIKNISPSPVDLTNWQIKTAAGQIFTLPSLMMTPQSIVVFYRLQTNLALNNLKEKLKLYTDTNLLIDGAEYKSSAPENQSYQRKNEDQYFWQEISPGENNIFSNEVLPQAMIIGPKEAKINEIISFDASDSYDPKNRPLEFFWDFGDGRKSSGLIGRTIYAKADTYEISLTAFVSQTASSTEMLKIKITDPSASLAKTQATTTQNLNQATTTPQFNQALTIIPEIFLSEFLPNPEGADNQNEFIEIFNAENYALDLAGFKLDDNEGGSRPYQILPKTIIQPNQYLAFYAKQTKIALNNDLDLVRLLAPTGDIIDQADYQEPQEAVSFVLDENFEWQKTNTPTPGEINILNQESRIMNQELNKDETTTTPKVLGVSTEDNKQPVNKLRYYLAGASALVILGLGTILKIRKKSQ